MRGEARFDSGHRRAAGRMEWGRASNSKVDERVRESCAGRARRIVRESGSGSILAEEGSSVKYNALKMFHNDKKAG